MLCEYLVVAICQHTCIGMHVCMHTYTCIGMHVCMHAQASDHLNIKYLLHHKIASVNEWIIIIIIIYIAP